MISAPAVAARSRAQVVCHRGSGALARALPAWEALLHQLPSTSIFSRPDWAAAWIRIYGRGRVPLLLEVREDGHPIGLMPLTLTRVAALGLRRLEFLGGSPTNRGQWLLNPDGHGLAYYNDILIAPGAEDRVMAELRRWLEKNGDRWDCLRLTSVPDHSPLVQQFETRLAQGWSPRLVSEPLSRSVDTSVGWETVVHSLAKRHRRHLRYEPGALARAAGGELALEEIRGDGVIGAIEEFIALHERRWAAEKRPGLPHGEAALYRRLAETGDEHFVVFRLVAGEKLLAAQFGFDHGDSYMPYNHTYNPDCGRHSPGHVLLQMVIERCCRRGVAEVDLIGLTNSERWPTVERRRMHLQAQRPGTSVGARLAVHGGAGKALLRLHSTSSGRRVRSLLAATVGMVRSAP